MAQPQYQHGVGGTRVILLIAKHHKGRQQIGTITLNTLDIQQQMTVIPKRRETDKVSPKLLQITTQRKFSPWSGRGNLRRDQ